MSWNKVAVVGAGMTKFGELFDKSWEHLLADAYLEALGSVDKGMEPSDIQAIWYGTTMGSLMGMELPGGAIVSTLLGLTGIPATRVENGCPTGSDTFRNAVLAVASGVYDVVLAIGAEKMRDKSTSEGLLSLASAGHPILFRGGTAPANFAPQATRHMHEFGTSKEQMAMVAVKNHHNSTFNPKAHFNFEISVEEVLKSPPVCSPLNLLDCCPQTDGAAAVIVCRADLAEKYSRKPVYVAGFGLGTDYALWHEKESFVEFAASRKAAQQAYAMAGIGPRQIDLAEVHDCFTITEILVSEDVGFCEKGAGGKFVEEGKSSLKGQTPINPSGGLLSKGHPMGATGLAQLSEIYWQLREEAGQRQVEIRSGYGMQHNVGATGIAASVVNILTRNPG